MPGSCRRHSKFRVSMCWCLTSLSMYPGIWRIESVLNLNSISSPRRGPRAFPVAQLKCSTPTCGPADKPCCSPLHLTMAYSQRTMSFPTQRRPPFSHFLSVTSWQEKHLPIAVLSQLAIILTNGYTAGLTMCQSLLLFHLLPLPEWRSAAQTRWLGWGAVYLLVLLASPQA